MTLSEVDGVVRDFCFLVYMLIYDPSLAPGAFRLAWGGVGSLRDLVHSAT